MSSPASVWTKPTGVAVAVAIAAVPLVVFPGLAYTHIASKALALRAVVLVCVAAMLWANIHRIARPKSWRGQPTPLRLLSAAVLLWAGITTLTAIDPSRSIWSSLERHEGLLTWVYIAGLAAVARHLSATRTRWWTQLTAATLCIAPIVVVHALVTDNELLRIGGSLGSPTFLGGYLAIHTVLALGWACTRSRSPQTRILTAIVAVFCVYGTWRTSTRGALLATVIGVFVAGAIGVGRQDTASTLKRLVVGVVGLAGLGLGGWALRTSQLFRESATLWRFSESSAAEPRLALWQMGWNASLDRPVFGWGLDNAVQAMQLNTIPHSALYGHHADRVHSFFLDQAVAHGWVGAALWLAVFLCAGTLLAVHPNFTRTERATGLGVGAVWLVHTGLAFPDIILWMVLGLGLAWLDSRTTPVRVATAHGERHKHSVPLGLAATGLLSAAALATIVMPANASLIMHRVLSVRSTMALSCATFLTMRDRPTPYKSDVLLDWGVDATLVATSSSAHRRPRCATDIAANSLYAHTARAPDNLHLRTMLAREQLVIGRAPAAAHTLGRILDETPNNVDALMLMATTQAQLGDISAAVLWCEQAHALLPADDPILITLATSLLLARRQTEALELLDRRADKMPSILLNNGVVATARQTGAAAQLTELWVKYAEQDRPQFRRKLAVFIDEYYRERGTRP